MSLLALLPLRGGAAAPDLASLYKDRRYFELRDALKEVPTPVDDQLFYQGILLNRFNRLERSSEALRRFLEQKPRESGLVQDAYETLAENHVKQHRYEEAADAYHTLLDRFGRQLSEPRKAALENVERMWRVLKDAAPQQVAVPADVKLKAPRDRAGLITLPVGSGDEPIDFVVDTGANLCTATESTARKLGFQMTRTTIEVGTITGKKVQARPAVAPELRIGGITVKNAVFLVMEDRDLAFPGYEIHGIVGLPVLAGFREFSYRRDGELSIPKEPLSGRPQNLCLHGFTPLVEAVYRERRLMFSLDTGAQRTLMFQPFFEAYADEIKGAAEPETQTLGGAGGARRFTVYPLKELVLEVGGKVARLPSVRVLTEPTGDRERPVHGNLGQDLLRQFDRMTLNFESMSFVLE